MSAFCGKRISDKMNSIISDNARVIAKWITEMQRDYGSNVYQTDDRAALDWGQALARGVYGPGWRDEPLDEVPDNALALAEQWTDSDNWPEWINRVW